MSIGHVASNYNPKHLDLLVKPKGWKLGTVILIINYFSLPSSLCSNFYGDSYYQHSNHEGFYLFLQAIRSFLMRGLLLGARLLISTLETETEMRRREEKWTKTKTKTKIEQQ
jgi:hypothetical protein